MDKEWFGMDDLKSRTFNNKVWIPLLAQKTLDTRGSCQSVGFIEEFFAAHSLIVAEKGREEACSLHWMDLQGGFGDRPWKDDEGRLRKPDVFEMENSEGVKPVLTQYIEIDRDKELHVHQDLILGLGLRRRGDSWYRPEEDDAEVIRLTRDEEGSPNLVEIKAEFLKDYLKAAHSGLLLLTFQSRHEIQDIFEQLDWSSGTEELTDSYRWTGHFMDVYEDSPFGGPVHVIEAGRNDVDLTEDIPAYEFPTDEKTWSKSYVVEPKGQKLVRAMAEIWKNEWISPGAVSPRVAGDEVPSTLEFIVDNEGRRETSETLRDPSRWLWFHPDVVNDLLKKQRSVLKWHTQETGSVGGAWHRKLHFGVNSLGLINVYAKDIANVDEIDKRVWFRHNRAPEGGVSAELQSVQMATVLPNTEAPEVRFRKLLISLDELFKSKFGHLLLRTHPDEQKILANIHRFKASNIEGVYYLCKEVTRIFTERVDVGALQKLHPQADNVGSLKRLERILTALGFDGRAIMGPLAGAYELRLADAHLPSQEKIDAAIPMVGVDYARDGLNSGKMLLVRMNDTLIELGKSIYVADPKVL